VPVFCTAASQARDVPSGHSVCMTARGELIATAAAAGMAGIVAVLVGVANGGAAGAVVTGLGVGAFVSACFVAIATTQWLGPSTRLPERLRNVVPRSEWRRTLASLELRDGRRITCVGVRPGGYVPPRKTDPPFDARDTVAVVPATEADWLAESERQSTGSS
jgi:hypothetical protein